jgi:hypothetical protein
MAGALLIFALAAQSPAGSTSPAPPQVSGTLRLVSVSPEPQSEVTKGTWIVAEVEYAVTAGFQPGLFYLATEVRPRDGERPLRRPIRADENPVLRKANGRLKLRFALAQVWDLPEVRRPLLLRFQLNHKTDGIPGPEGARETVASTGPVEYPAR